MRSNDLNTSRAEIRTRLQEALRENNTDNFYAAFDELIELIGTEIRGDYDAQINALREDKDRDIMLARGCRQLTSEERGYYQRLAEAMRSPAPKQALSDANLVIPETVIDAVLENVRTEHPLLDHIDFVSTGGAVKMLMNTNSRQSAAWGTLCAEIVTEMLAGFKEVDVTLCKLSAFLPVCKAMLDLGPEYLDRFIRETLEEALANGAEDGFIDGTGKNQPIGMTRQVGPGTVVTDGVYPRKNKISVTDLSPKTVGNLISLLATDENGKDRVVDDVILIVNPVDYLTKIFPATTMLAADGTYRRDVLPYPMTVIPTAALSRNDAIIGIGNRYFAPIGMARDGKIDYSDEYHFLEDERVYLAKLYANGLPKDNNSFLYLDITDLEPLQKEVVVVDERAPNDDATLASLKLGSLTLTPAFDPAVTSYTAATTAATTVIKAIPTDVNADVEIAVGETVIDNGTAATWAAGSNTVTITVTAADGTTDEEYTVTVTKS